MMTGAEFKAALERLGITQAAFAERFKLSPVSVNRWARGRVSVPYWAEVVITELHTLVQRQGAAE